MSAPVRSALLVAAAGGAIMGAGVASAGDVGAAAGVGGGGEASAAAGVGGGGEASAAAGVLIPVAGMVGFPAETGHLRCDGAPMDSRWAAGGEREYRPIATTADAEAFWLQSVAGLDSDLAGRTVVYDEIAARIHILDPDFAPLASFGRRGQGPGELSFALAAPRPPGYHYNMAALLGDTVAVFDGSRLLLYDADGGFIASTPPYQRFGAAATRSSGVRASDGRLFFGVVETSTRPPFERHFRVQEVEAASAELAELTSIPLEPLPSRSSDRPGSTLLAQQARPLFAVGRDCLVLSDGSSRQLDGTDLDGGATWTRSLPEHEVELLEPRENPAFEAMREAMAERGFRITDLDGLEPTSLLRWSEMVMDPDGHVWVLPWRPASDREPPVEARPAAERGAPVEAFRVDPAGGVHVETLPAFPLAFGPPGSFLSVETDATTDELHVVRWELR